MTGHPLRSALSELFSAIATTGATPDVRAAAVALTRRKDLKEALAPVAGLFTFPLPSRIVQACIALPPDSVAHRVVAELVEEGVVARPWIPVAAGPLPRRTVYHPLLVSRRERVVYANEDKLVSMWSLDTGAHLGDLKVPVARVQTSELVELADGTLRVVTLSKHRWGDGKVFERAPGAPAFRKVQDLGEIRNSVGTADLGWIVGQMDSAPTETPTGREHRIAVHDVARRRSHELRVPGAGVRDGMVACGDRVVFLTSDSRQTGPGDEDWIEEAWVVVVDLATVTFRRVPVPLDGCSPSGIERIHAASGPDPARVAVRLSPPDGAFVYRTFFVGTESFGPGEEPARVPPGTLTCRRHDDAVVDDQGRVVCTYGLEGDPYHREAARVPGEDTFVLAGADPACAVVVVRPYAPGHAATPPEPPPAPLRWAVPGVSVTYEIADFDVEDRWTFDVVAADEGLTVRVRTGEGGDVVAAALECTAEAAAKAIRPIAFAQGGADVDVGQPQAKQLPPLLVSRATHTKLAAGKEAPFHSEWSEKVQLTASRARASLRVDDREVTVAVLQAADADGQVSMTILDDPRWPLVIDRTEGDCSVRLLGITTGGRGVAAPAPPTVAPPAPPTPGGATDTRRYEFTEGASGKFWEVSQDGARVTVRFGKLGTAGQTQVKDLGTEADATREREKLEREKTKKGYVRA